MLILLPSATIKVQQALLFQIAFQMVADADRSHPGRCTGEDKVACAQSKESREISDELVDGVQHVGTITLLHRLSVHIQMKT